MNKEIKRIVGLWDCNNEVSFGVSMVKSEEDW
jgi:hypothetical protein